jgi:hypothetical protein
MLVELAEHLRADISEVGLLVVENAFHSDLGECSNRTDLEPTAYVPFKARFRQHHLAPRHCRSGNHLICAVLSIHSCAFALPLTRFRGPVLSRSMVQERCEQFAPADDVAVPIPRVLIDGIIVAEFMGLTIGTVAIDDATRGASAAIPVARGCILCPVMHSYGGGGSECAQRSDATINDTARYLQVDMPAQRRDIRRAH